eukprot:6469536-Amphidinium_carterae.1
MARVEPKDGQTSDLTEQDHDNHQLNAMANRKHVPAQVISMASHEPACVTVTHQKRCFKQSRQESDSAPTPF